MAIKGFLVAGPVQVYASVDAGPAVFVEAYSDPNGRAVREWVRPPAKRQQIDVAIPDQDDTFRVEFDVSAGNVLTLEVEQAGKLVWREVVTEDDFWTFQVL